jgi:hypothetical protein
MAASQWPAALDALLSRAFPLVRPGAERPSDRSTSAFWLVPPAQTAADFLLWSLFFAWLLWALPRARARLWPLPRSALWLEAVPASAPAPAPLSAAGAAQAALWLVDMALRAAVWCTAASTLWIKLSTGRGLFLLQARCARSRGAGVLRARCRAPRRALLTPPSSLPPPQPCHLSNALLCALTVVDARGRWGGVAARALWVDLLAKYGTMAALVWPDIGPSPVFGETASFFVQHWVLTLLPAVWLLRRRFALFRGARALAYAWAAVGALHFGLLLPVGALTGNNINYMFAPPPGVYPRALPLLYYRSAIAVAGVPIAVAMRYGLVAPLATLGGALAAAAEAGAGSRADSADKRAGAKTQPPAPQRRAASRSATRSGGARRR